MVDGNSSDEDDDGRYLSPESLLVFPCIAGLVLFRCSITNHVLTRNVSVGGGDIRFGVFHGVSLSDKSHGPNGEHGRPDEDGI